jgi:hemerythrin-like domain-containing protein
MRGINAGGDGGEDDMADPARRDSDESGATGQPSPLASRDLRAEHILVLRVIKILEALRPRITRGDVPPAEDWDDIVTFLRVFVDRCHHGKEERVLFPALMQAADDSTRALIQELLVEHVEGRRLVAALATAAGTEPVLPGDPKGERTFDPAAAEAAIAAYVSLIRPHIVHEEKRLFPSADRILAPEIQVTLQEEYDLIERETVGDGRREAFERTVTRLQEKYLPHRHR